MSRKDYIMLASVLKDNNATIDLCHNMAIKLKQDNGSFDINRFMTACGH